MRCGLEGERMIENEKLLPTTLRANEVKTKMDGRGRNPVLET